jgi:hypothetical protein
MPVKDKIKLRGRVEIINKETGEKILDADNLVLLMTRATILQVLFNDDKVMQQVSATSNILPKLTIRTETTDPETETTITNETIEENYPQINGYRRMICGFVFGNNGSEINTNPAIVRVPSPVDIANVGEPINDNEGDFIALPMINISGSEDVKILNTSGSYENLSEIINDYSITNNAITSENYSVSTNVQYFNLAPFSEGTDEDITAYYCKSFKTEYNQTTIDPTTSEIDYRIELDIENYDLVGQTFSEIGLVIADCKVINGVITEILPNSGTLATRVTFNPISLSTQLSSQFSIYYHIYI